MLLRRNLLPRFSVFGNQQFESERTGLVSDRIAKNDAMGAVPECDGVEKTFGIFVGELQLPVPARICCVVDARLIARPGRHEKRLLVRKGSHAAEIERLGAGNLFRNPPAAIGGSHIGTMASRGPGNLL